MIFVTTAGKVGSAAARLIAQREVPVRVLVRQPEKAAALAQLAGKGAVTPLESGPKMACWATRPPSLASRSPKQRSERAVAQSWPPSIAKKRIPQYRRTNSSSSSVDSALSSPFNST